MMNSIPDLNQMIEDSIAKALKNRGMVNVLLAGKTGVGKSTLINAVFQKKMADTGDGKPITQKTRKITKEGVPLSLYDTRGLELKNFKENFAELEKVVKTTNNDSDPNRHIHVGWICIEEGNRRVEDAEIELCKILSNYMPVLVVITKASSDNGFKSKVQSLMPDARNVIRTNSVSSVLDDGHIIPAAGLETLVEATSEVIPEAQRNAFVAAQKVSTKEKVNKAHGIVGVSAASAATAAAVPIPFSDAIALVPIQVGMLAGITAVFGMDLKRSFLATLVSSSITGTGATILGRTIVANLAKLIPGAGSILGGAIAASTAALMTTAFGEAYIGTLAYLLKGRSVEEITNEEILKEFKSRLTLKKSTTAQV